MYLVVALITTVYDDDHIVTLFSFVFVVHTRGGSKAKKRKRERKSARGVIHPHLIRTQRIPVQREAGTVVQGRGIARPLPPHHPLTQLQRHRISEQFQNGRMSLLLPGGVARQMSLLPGGVVRWMSLLPGSMAEQMEVLLVVGMATWTNLLVEGIANRVGGHLPSTKQKGMGLLLGGVAQ